MSPLLMSINFIDGDIVEVFQQAQGKITIVHGVSCFPVLGAGLALQLTKLNPSLLKSHKAYLESFKNKANALGTYTVFHASPQKKIVNLYQQLTVSRKEPTLILSAFEQAIKDFAKKQHSYTPIYFPYKIGCGLAGGRWEDVLEIIAENIDYFYIVKLPNATNTG